MKVVKEAKTTVESYAKALEYGSSCCGDNCKLLCKKCPPMKD